MKGELSYRQTGKGNVNSQYSCHRSKHRSRKLLRVIINLTQQQGGFISNSYIYDAGGRDNGQITIKVPAKNFYTAISGIETIWNSENQKDNRSGRYRQEFIDLNARP